MVSLNLLFLAGCGFGLENGDVDLCALGKANCCTGTVDTVGPDGAALQVVADMTCPDAVGVWAIHIDGAPVTTQHGDSDHVTTTLDLDLDVLQIAEGAHTLSLVVAPEADVDSKEVASTDFTYGTVDTADSGDADTDTDTDSDTDADTDTDTTAPSRAELSPGDVYLTPETGNRGDSLSLSFKVYSYGEINAGATSADVYWSTDLVVDGGDTLLTDVDVPALTTGSNTTLGTNITIPSDAELGDAFVLVVLDPDDKVEESDETNNLGYSPAVVAGPDLGVDSLTLSSSAGSADVDVDVDWVVENVGGDTSESFDALLVWSTDETYGFGDITLATWTEPALGAGDLAAGTETVRIPDTTDDGYVLLVLDPNADIEDLDRGNNTLTAAYATQAVDLAITLDGVSPSTGSAGDAVSVAMTLSNIGTDRAGAFDVAVYASSDSTFDGGDSRLTGASASYLNGGTTSSITLPVTMPSTLGFGVSYLIAVIDEGGTVVETDEGNNASYGTFEVVGPNYVATAESVGTSTPARGSPFRFTWSITNDGSAASTDTTTGLYISSDTSWSSDDTMLASQTTSALGASSSTGSTATVVTVPTSIAYGAWYLLVVADSGSVLSEGDESDNVSAIYIVVS